LVEQSRTTSRGIPRDVLNEVVAPRLEERLALQQFYHDRSVRQLPELAPEQIVSIQYQWTLKWKPADVREKSGHMLPQLEES